MLLSLLIYTIYTTMQSMAGTGVIPKPTAHQSPLQVTLMEGNFNIRMEKRLLPLINLH